MSHLHQRVSALVDGELKGRARDRALAHSRRCTACQEEIAATLSLKQRLFGLPAAEPAADLFSALGLVTPEGRRPDEPSRGRVGPRGLLLGAGSLSLAVLSVAYAVGAPNAPESTLVAPPLEDYIAQFARDSTRTALADPAVSILASSALTARIGARELKLNPPAPLATSSAGDDPRAVQWLRSAVAAPLEYAYHGTRVIKLADEAQLLTAQVEVDHAPGKGTSSYAGGLPNSSASFVEAGPTAAVDRLSTDAFEELVATFDIQVGAPTDLLGRPTAVIEAIRDGQLAARFWVDQASGLLVRRDVYDGRQLVRSSRFTSLNVTRQAVSSHSPPRISAPTANALSMQFSPALRDEGWTCPDSLPGGGSLISLRRLEGAQEGVQATYTDGLFTTSVFQQRGTLDPHSVDLLAETFHWTKLRGGSSVYLRSGLPTVAVWQSGPFTYTVVTDAVPSAAEDVFFALPHEATSDQRSDNRFATGLGRMWALLDPTS
ncbi:MAG: hypothetical protein H0V49_07340 [Nocardioidaceae bacterium]|nr:hypothetical protein [Nocardioidaceae bacterium]